MKLRNLMYATMVACAFASCSNEDDPSIDGPQAADLDATLTVAFGADGKMRTRSIGAEKNATDETIKTIGIAVFNNGAMSPAMEEGELISYRVIARNGVDTTACVSAKSGEVEVMVVVNPAGDELKGLTTRKQFQEAVSGASLHSQINGNLLMSSPIYRLTLDAGRNVACSEGDKNSITWPDKENTSFHKATYKVYRNVGKIILNSIKIAPRADFGQLANYATFTLDSVYVDHVRPGVQVFGNNPLAWNSVKDVTKKGFLTGLLDPSYKGDNYLLDTFEDVSVTYKGNSDEAIITKEDGLTSFYVYDNSSEQMSGVVPANTATRVVLKGTYTYKTGNAGEEVITSEHAYWSFEINNDANNLTVGQEFSAHYGVLRNVQYVVNATITGPGKGTDPTEPIVPPVDPTDPIVPPVDPEDPDGEAACIKVKVEVANWGEVIEKPTMD